MSGDRNAQGGSQVTPEERIEARRFRWDGTITAGNVLTAATVMFAVLVWGLRLEGQVERGAQRLNLLETQQRDTQVSREVMVQQVGQLREAMAEVRANVNAQLAGQQRIERTVETLNTRLTTMPPGNRGAP